MCRTWEHSLADLRLTGADVLTPAGVQQVPLSIAGGVVSDEPVARDVDLSGYLVLPGIVDMHGDGFERHLAPRRGAMKQMAEGLIATEAELAANGITTAVLAQFASWEGGIRSPEFAGTVLSAVRDTAPSLSTDIRGQLRFEISQLDLYDDLPARIADWQVGYVVFNDHLAHDRLREGRRPPGLVGQALKAARNPEVHLEMLQNLHAGMAEVPAALDALCAALAAQGVRMGSHDDATREDRAAWQTRGVSIAEFPETIEAAEATKDAGGTVVLGSPNAVRGGSHKGNASAIDLIAMGYCDALASDYHYPSPRRAALMLADTGMVGFTKAWGLVSSGPARALGLTDRGTLEPGKRADLVILDASTRRVAATIAGGVFSHVSGRIAERFFG